MPTDLCYRMQKCKLAALIVGLFQTLARILVTTDECDYLFTDTWACYHGVLPRAEHIDDWSNSNYVRRVAQYQESSIRAGKIIKQKRISSLIITGPHTMRGLKRLSMII